MMDKKYQGLSDISARIHFLPNIFSRSDLDSFEDTSGRAMELPDVKELFESRKKVEDEENATHDFYKKVSNQGPSYFGDLDEADGDLLKYEKAAEQERTLSLLRWQT